MDAARVLFSMPADTCRGSKVGLDHQLMQVRFSQPCSSDINRLSNQLFRLTAYHNCVSSLLRLVKLHALLLTIVNTWVGPS